ncbi:MAG: hypothetical protein Q9220_006423 [cf. Caloplaca sp. 1 TL-2023]
MFPPPQPSHQSPPPVRACIFDVDGLLINSEDIYTDIYNKVLHAHGKKSLTWATKALQQSRGQIGHERILSADSLPLSVDDFRTEAAPYSSLFHNSKPLPGVLTLLANLASASPPISLAIASSTSRAHFETKMAHLPDLTGNFSRKCTLLADDEDMKGKRGKPAGDVFLLAMERMNAALLESSQGAGGTAPKPVTPGECLVFEDSIAGVAAGRAAGLRVIWVPHHGLRKVCQGLERDILQGEMEKVEQELLRRQGTEMDLDATAAEGDDEGGFARVKSDDGMAEMIESLEDVDFVRYGIKLRT